MSTTKYDRYGRPAGFIPTINNEVDPYLVDKASATVTYACFFETGTAPRAIHRFVKAGTVTQVTVAWGAWSDRASLTYYPINTYLEVDNETGALVYPTEPAPELETA